MIVIDRAPGHQDTRGRIQDAGCKTQDARRKMQDTLRMNTDIYRDEHRCKMQDARYRRQRGAPEHQSTRAPAITCVLVTGALVHCVMW